MTHVEAKRARLTFCYPTPAEGDMQRDSWKRPDPSIKQALLAEAQELATTLTRQLRKLSIKAKRL